MIKILFVEDDQVLNEGVSFGLRQKGYDVTAFTHSLKCLNSIADRKNTYNLAILDIGLPDIDGFTLAERVKAFHNIPIVFLTAKDDEKEILKGYTLGCEDYVTKPFSLPVLLEKIKVILRRTAQNSEANTYFLDGLCLDFEKVIFKKDKEELSLTSKEKCLLETFISHRNQILTKEQLLERVWDVAGAFVDENTLSVTIGRLRKKIEEDPQNPKWIKTVFGIGYKWCDE